VKPTSHRMPSGQAPKRFNTRMTIGERDWPARVFGDNWGAVRAVLAAAGQRVMCPKAAGEPGHRLPS
jgi:hypothetical protein